MRSIRGEATAGAGKICPLLQREFRNSSKTPSVLRRQWLLPVMIPTGGGASPGFKDSGGVLQQPANRAYRRRDRSCETPR